MTSSRLPAVVQQFLEVPSPVGRTVGRPRSERMIMRCPYNTTLAAVALAALVALGAGGQLAAQDAGVTGDTSTPRLLLASSNGSGQPISVDVDRSPLLSQRI